MNIAIIDDSEVQLKFFSKLFHRSFNRKDDNIDTFLFPDESGKLFENRDRYDLILVDYSLGNTNGADYATSIFVKNFRGKLVVFSASEKTDLTKFTYYFNKSDIAKNPKLLIGLPDNEIAQAMEMSYLSHRELIY